MLEKDAYDNCFFWDLVLAWVLELFLSKKKVLFPNVVIEPKTKKILKEELATLI